MMWGAALNTDPDGLPKNVLHIPRSMLWIVVIDTLLWCAAVPAAMAFRYGMLEWLSVAAMGVVFAPIVVLSIFIARLLMYFTVVIYWYITGLRALITMAFGVGVIVLVLFFPVNAPPIDPRQITGFIPSQSAPGVSALLVIFALIAVFFLGRLSTRKSAAPNSPAAPAAPASPQPQNIQAQIAQRQARLKQPPKP